VAAASVRFALRTFARLHGQRGSVGRFRELARRIYNAHSRLAARVYVSHDELDLSMNVLSIRGLLLFLYKTVPHVVLEVPTENKF
jgi:hypothetical protein